MPDEPWRQNWEDYYEILQVEHSADPETIEAAFIRLAERYNPDADLSSKATEKIESINTAHDVLSDPAKREEYHQEWLKRQRKAPYEAPQSTTTPPPAPANIELTDFLIRPKHIQLGSSVTVSLIATNKGGTAGSKIILMVGDFVRAQTVTLDPDAKTVVNFTITPKVIGQFEITVNRFTGSFLVTTYPPPPEETVLSDFLIRPQQIRLGSSVTVSVVATNNGSNAVSETISMGGDFTGSQTVTIDPGVPTIIEFTLTPEKIGTFNVAIGNFSGNFNVTDPSVPPPSTKPPLKILVLGRWAIGIVVLGIAIALAVYFGSTCSTVTPAPTPTSIPVVTLAPAPTLTPTLTYTPMRTPTPTIVPTPQIVIFPDANLQAAIRHKIGKPTGDIYRSDLVDLTALNAGNLSISDITGLESCTNLTLLWLSSNQVSNISPLAGLTNLTLLYLDSNQIGNISALSDLTKLTELDLACNQVGNISALSNLANLALLNLYSNQIGNISALSGLTNLTLLNLDSNQIGNISAVSGLTNLTELDLACNQIGNISALSGLTKLTELDLACNQIGDISALSDLAKLTELDLAYNQVGNISALSGLINLTLLNLGSNQIGNISPLVNNPGLAQEDTVDLYNNPLSPDSINVYVTQLQARGVKVSYNVPDSIPTPTQGGGIDYCCGSYGCPAPTPQPTPKLTPTP